jgi:hypothetical protein
VPGGHGPDFSSAMMIKPRAVLLIEIYAVIKKPVPRLGPAFFFGGFLESFGQFFGLFAFLF